MQITHRHQVGTNLTAPLLVMDRERRDRLLQFALPATLLSNSFASAMMPHVHRLFHFYPFGFTRTGLFRTT